MVARSDGSGRLQHLIVTADDFGLAPEVNEAVEAAHCEGILNAASLMVAGAAAADAARRARSLPHLRVGLHLVLVEGEPALPPAAIPDLIDRRGRLRTDLWRLGCAIAFRPAVLRQVAAEITAQFEAFRATGLPLDHVNAHKHFHLHPRVGALVVAIGRRYGMRALRIPSEPASVLGRIERSARAAQPLSPWTGLLRRRAGGLTVPDAVFGLRWSGAMTRERLSGLLENLPPGVIEIYTHPATSDRFPGHARGYRYRDEFEALRDPACIDAVRRSGYRSGGYADVPTVRASADVGRTATAGAIRP